jgi:uncharacterized repeat protein (TIGR01451 family)
MRLIRVAVATTALTVLLAAPASAGGGADLSVTKVDTTDPVTPGDVITYSITVQNLGSAPAPNVTLSDTIPPGTTFFSLTSPGGWTLTAPPVGGTGTVTANIATMPVGSAAFTFEVRVDADIKPGIVTNTANVTSNLKEINTSNNTSAATTDVVAAAASVPDAAMAASRPGSPLTILGFAALLAGLLATTALMAVRRTRT